MKRVQGEPTKKGMTGLLLSVAGLVGKTTEDVIEQALEKVKTTQVWEWGKKYLGKTIAAKRKEVFTAAAKREQKWDQLPVPG